MDGGGGGPRHRRRSLSPARPRRRPRRRRHRSALANRPTLASLSSAVAADGWGGRSHLGCPRRPPRSSSADPRFHRRCRCRCRCCRCFVVVVVVVVVVSLSLSVTVYSRQRVPCTRGGYSPWGRVFPLRRRRPSSRGSDRTDFTDPDTVTKLGRGGRQTHIISPDLRLCLA